MRWTIGLCMLVVSSSVAHAQKLREVSIEATSGSTNERMYAPAGWRAAITFGSEPLGLRLAAGHATATHGDALTYCDAYWPFNSNCFLEPTRSQSRLSMVSAEVVMSARFGRRLRAGFTGGLSWMQADVRDQNLGTGRAGGGMAKSAGFGPAIGAEASYRPFDGIPVSLGVSLRHAFAEMHNCATDVGEQFCGTLTHNQVAFGLRLEVP